MKWRKTDDREMTKRELEIFYWTLCGGIAIGAALMTLIFLVIS